MKKRYYNIRISINSNPEIPKQEQGDAMDCSIDMLEEYLVDLFANQSNEEVDIQLLSIKKEKKK